jgi:hypothetical protein
MGGVGREEALHADPASQTKLAANGVCHEERMRFSISHHHQ